MLGNATLTIVVSTISSSVAVTIASVISARRRPNSTTLRGAYSDRAGLGLAPLRETAAAEATGRYFTLTDVSTDMPGRNG